jgi:hypothetical protein
MKNIGLVIILNLLILNVFSQKEYFVELNYENFVGEYYHEGGVGMRITYDGTVFTIYDLVDLGKSSSGKIERVHIGFPYEGMIKYQVAGTNKWTDGPNKYEFMKFSLDFENKLLVGYYNHAYVKDGLKLRTKEITRSDLEFLSYFVGVWTGTYYGDYPAKCKIFFVDGQMFYQDILKGTTCKLWLTQGKKLFGEIYYDGNYHNYFELYFDEHDNLIYNDYDASITYTEVEDIE